MLTLGRLLDQYEAMRLREGVQIKSLPKTMRLLRQHLKPYLALPAVEFSKADLRDVRNVLVEAGTPAAANKVLSSFGPVLRWAAEEDFIPANFTSAIRRTPVTARRRVLTKAEIAAIWKACDRLEHYGRMVRFLLLTAQRLDEAARSSMAISSMASGARPKTNQAGRIRHRCPPGTQHRRPGRRARSRVPR